MRKGIEIMREKNRYLALARKALLSLMALLVIDVAVCAAIFLDVGIPCPGVIVWSLFAISMVIYARHSVYHIEAERCEMMLGQLGLSAHERERIESC